VLQRGLKDAFGAAAIGIEKISEISRRFNHRGNVINDFGTLHGARDRGGIAEIAANDFGAEGFEFIGAGGRTRQSAHRNALR
jgi:hypothetical protein